MDSFEFIPGLVSIIMPAYNAERYLEAAIESVLSQSYADWELYVANDASKDRTIEIVEKFVEVDKRIKLINLDQNAGVACARNRALEKAKGQYIAFLDSDDMWDADKLSMQLAIMATTDCSICYTNYRRINELGEIIGHVRSPARLTYEDMLKSNFIGNLTGMYDAGRLGKQYLSSLGHEDYIGWLELLKRSGAAICVPEELASYRVYGGSISSNKFRAMRWQWQIYRKSQELQILKSCWYMCCYMFYAVMKRTG